MPYIELAPEKHMYYEIHGKENNPTVVLLSGIMMSVASWSIFLEGLTKHLRVILVDLRDQGRSSQHTENYTIELHVSDLEILLSKLSIESVHLYGISYGAQVAMLYALNHPNRVKTLILFNAPARTTPYLAQIGEAWKEAARTQDGAKFFQLAIPYAYSFHFYNRALPWLQERQKQFKTIMTPQWFESFMRLASTNENFDVVNRLRAIQCPVLLVGSDKDMITPIEEMELIQNQIPHAEFLIIHQSGHASIIEKPGAFITALTGFVLKHS